MRHLRLRPLVSYGLVDGHAVFLDLERDRYLALDPLAEEAFRLACSTSAPLPRTCPRQQRLLATGLFREAAAPGRLSPAAVAVPPVSLLDETADHRGGWTSTPRAAVCVVRARRRLARKPLADIVGALRQGGRAIPGRAAAASLEDAARTYLAARALLPIERKCLPDALALLDWLGDRARAATLVFGVRTNPFGAHCWVQTERSILTDARDTVAGFVPVLAVRCG